MIFKDYYDKENGALLKKFDEVLEMFEHAHPDKYRDIKNDIYVLMHGYHFNEDMLECAYDKMINDDGSKAPKWDIASTTQLAKTSGIAFDKFNEYDFNYVMNMLYSDYVKIFNENTAYYVKMADKFLNDKDAEEGKALRYYMAMN